MKQLQEFLQDAFPQISFNLICTNTKTIGSLFRFKDSLPVDARSNVVYKYTCRCCNASYVGSTSRHFRTRICDHLQISGRTSRPLLNPSYSAIAAHAASNKHSLSPDDFTIIHQSNKSDLLTTESIAILLNKPILNRQDCTQPLMVTSLDSGR